jgi:hypothetical protein
MPASGRTQTFQVYSMTLSARIVLGHQRRARMPATNAKPRDDSQGFTGLPLVVASFRHVTMTHAGLSLPA